MPANGRWDLRNLAFKGLKETDTFKKTGRKFVWGSHRPLHRAANVKSPVANEETGFKVLTFNP